MSVEPLDTDPSMVSMSVCVSYIAPDGSTLCQLCGYSVVSAQPWATWLSVAVTPMNADVMTVMAPQYGSQLLNTFNSQPNNISAFLYIPFSTDATYCGMTLVQQLSLGWIYRHCSQNEYPNLLLCLTEVQWTPTLHLSAPIYSGRAGRYIQQGRDLTVEGSTVRMTRKIIYKPIIHTVWNIETCQLLKKSYVADRIKCSTKIKCNDNNVWVIIE